MQLLNGFLSDSIHMYYSKFFFQKEISRYSPSIDDFDFPVSQLDYLSGLF